MAKIVDEICGQDKYKKCGHHKSSQAKDMWVRKDLRYVVVTGHGLCGQDRSRDIGSSQGHGICGQNRSRYMWSSQVTKYVAKIDYSRRYIYGHHW